MKRGAAALPPLRDQRQPAQKTLSVGIVAKDRPAPHPASDLQTVGERANEPTAAFTGFIVNRARGFPGELENAVFADVDVEDLRVSVMGGPRVRAGTVRKFLG